MILLLAMGGFLLTSCSVMQGLTSPYGEREYRNKNVMANAATGHKVINVYLDRQVGELYVNGSKGLIFPVSTGIPGHSTPTGDFRIFDKELNNTSSLYGTIYNSKDEVVVPYANTRRDHVPPGGYYKGASMPYTMRFTDMCAFHAGIVPEQPTLTSHGCIHLTEDMAKELYQICPIGTRVYIYSSSPPKTTK